MDLRHNPCEKFSLSPKYKKAMAQQFYKNIKSEVERIREFGNSRIKIDWIYPDALMLSSNKLDEYNRHDLLP